MTTTTLTTDFEARKQAILNTYENTMKGLRERQEYRAENYYNCVDDYSYGSPYHAAADSMVEHEARIKRDYALEMLENGYVTIDSHCPVLKNFDDEVCAVGVLYGKYGSFFPLINGGCVSVAKKQSTYEAKGYRLFERKRVFHAIFTGKVSSKGNPVFSSIELVSEEYTVCGNNYNGYGREDYIDWLYSQTND